MKRILTIAINPINDCIDNIEQRFRMITDEDTKIASLNPITNRKRKK